MRSIATMLKYEEYIDSGVEWLGEVPNDWKLSKFKYCFTKSNAGEVIDKSYWGVGDETLYTCNRTPMLSNYRKFDDTRRATNEDLLLTRNGTPYVHLPFSGSIYSNVVQRVRLNFGLNRKFVWYALSNSSNYLGGYGDIIESFNMSTWKELVISIPPIDEQLKIVSFLDSKVLYIDEAIAIKEKQIELLKERKQIIIQKAVTQGLNPDAPMKDSGVGWIGEIPAHWEVKRAKYLFNEIDERSTTGKEELLSVSHMTGVTPRSEKNVSMFMAEDYTGSKVCRENDLVINIMWAWMGALGVSNHVGIVSPSYGVFRQKRDNIFNPFYLEYLLKSTKYVEYYNKVSTGLHSSRLRFYGHMLFAMKIGYPSFEEQNEIVAYLQEKNKRIDMSLDVQEEQIEKLKEYKTTLINNAVTGKIKVA